jgi:Protein of unknown function (DUF2950)
VGIAGAAAVTGVRSDLGDFEREGLSAHHERFPQRKKAEMETKEIHMKPHKKHRAHRAFRGWLCASLLLAVVSAAGCSGKKSDATNGAQTTFATPAEAGQALEAAAQANDQTALARILGPNSKTILSSGDPVEDQEAVGYFATKYKQMNRWVAMTDGTQMLNIGADNYPFPIPLAQDSSAKWYFNTKAGEDELLARQIGKNELLAIDAVTSIGNAEEVYFQKAHDGGAAHQYTGVIISTPGKQDGLYWEVPDGQPASPLGNVKDFAPSALSSAGRSDSTVFDGYSFRILTAQGDKAKGGSKSYLVNGKLTGGFAVIASPVKYRDSGIMTFIMSREGIVYQTDLGQNTADAAASIKEYNPAEGWMPGDE